MKVSIIGASGYTGGELLRLLVQHPEVEIKYIFSRKNEGKYVHEIHPFLKNILNIKFASFNNIESAFNSDIIFSCVPHGVSMNIIPSLIESGVKIIDLSADFRLKSVEEYKAWYNIDHKNPELLNEFIYGIPEINKEKISSASLVSNPGCIAIASILALYPFAKRRKISDLIFIDAKVGSSGSGRSIKLSSIFSERFGSIRAYKAAMHRHTPEIEEQLRMYSGVNLNVSLSAHSVNNVRGILVTSYVNYYDDVSNIWSYFREDYGSEKFVRIIRNPSGIYKLPDPKFLIGSNFVDIGFELDNRNKKTIIISALDNLVKGAAGNAIQCMNLMFGLKETEGLLFPPIYPV
jgi:N-acetyl-gamma-glutamyl-phosphate reductase, common form